MNVKDFLNQKIEYLLTKDTSCEIIRKDISITKLIELIQKMLDDTNFVLVYLDDEDKIKGIITYGNLNIFIDLLKQQRSKGIGQLKDLSISNKLLPNYKLNKNKKASDLLAILKNKETNIVIVVDDDEKYLGVISRKGFVSMLEKTE